MKERTKQLLSSKWWRLNHLYKIVDKERSLVAIRFNEEQAKLYNSYANKKKSGQLLRELQLKNRQIGMTTFHAIYMLDSCLFTRNQNCGIIAHEQESLEKIFRIVKTAWENMPEALRPKASLENIRELHFPHSNSTIFITLKARSGTLSHLHISEYAKIRDVQELKAGSFQAAGAGDITIEFTAQGINHAYEHWYSEDRVWTRHFFPWHEHKEYKTDRKYEGDRVYEDYLNKYGVSEEQKNWWYYKLDELSDASLMKQEYPSDQDEAYQTTSRSVFQDCLAHVSEATPIETINEPHLTVNIYKHPEDSGQYVIGADPSGGYADGDFSSFYILDNRTRQVCLRWHGRLDPDRFGREIVKYATKYNYAFVVPEINNHGLTVVQAMLNDGYTEIYQRQRRDKVSEDITLEWGWNTNTQSRDELIDEVKAVLRDGSVKEVPGGLLKELRTFVKTETGKCQAEVGQHDDEVFAFGLALMGIRFRPYFEITSKRNKYMGR